MHIRWQQKIEDKLNFWRKKLLPRTLFFRTMLLIFVPLIVVQIVSVVVFFDGSWSRMGRRLSENLVGDIKIVVALKEKGIPDGELKEMAGNNFGIMVGFFDEPVSMVQSDVNPVVVAYLREALEKNFGSGNWVVAIDKKESANKDLIIWIKQGKIFYQFFCSKKQIFSSSIFMFVVWMVATSVLLFLVSVLFLRIQVRAIADLAQTAENFGKGVDDDGFKPYGSSEVRKAGVAFIKMKERILKQMMERTQMLAGISHDLRTPLTRMKLMVTMMDKSNDKQDFLADIDEMEKMLNGYLAFVRGEGAEVAQEVDIKDLVRSVVARFASKKVKLKCVANDEVKIIMVKEQALRRAISNVVGNACRYAKKIVVRVEESEKNIKILVDDNGPGIPKDKREAVFRAFYRLEDSRNKETGGIGLGLAITKDIVTSHGGRISLEDSELGGLRVVITLPL